MVLCFSPCLFVGIFQRFERLVVLGALSYLNSTLRAKGYVLLLVVVLVLPVLTSGLLLALTELVRPRLGYVNSSMSSPEILYELAHFVVSLDLILTVSQIVASLAEVLLTILAVDVRLGLTELANSAVIGCLQLVHSDLSLDYMG